MAPTEPIEPPKPQTIVINVHNPAPEPTSAAITRALRRALRWM